MEGSSDVVDTTFAVGEFDSRKVWKFVYPYLLNGEINFEGQYGRLLGPLGPPEDQRLFAHRAKLRDPGVAACLARKPSGVCDLGTISALSPEREAQAVTFGCEHGLSAAIFEEVDLSSSVTVDAALLPRSEWVHGSLDCLRAGSDRVYGVEKVVFSPLTAKSTSVAAGSAQTESLPAPAGTSQPQTPVVATARRRVWEAPDGVFQRQPAEVFRSGKTGKVVWRTPSAKPLPVGSSAVLVAYTGKLDVEYLASIYNCSLENAAIILSVLSTKYYANARSVSPISIKAYDEETLRLEGSIVRGMSGGFVADPADPTKVHAYQIKSRKLAALNNDQEVTASSLMKRSFEGDMASYAMSVHCPWFACAYCDVVLPELMDVEESEWPAPDSFADLNDYLEIHGALIARVDHDTQEQFRLKQKVDAFVRRYNGHPVVWS